MTIKMLEEEEEHVIIKIGYQNGGLCSKFGVKMEQFVRQRKHMQHSLEGDGVFALGGSTKKLDLVRKIVKSCIVENANHVALVTKHRKDRLNHKIDQLNRKIFTKFGLCQPAAPPQEQPNNDDHDDGGIDSIDTS